jgi:hypothetical protein
MLSISTGIDCRDLHTEFQPFCYFIIVREFRRSYDDVHVLSFTNFLDYDRKKSFIFKVESIVDSS